MKHEKNSFSIESIIAVLALCTTLFLAIEMTVRAFMAIVPCSDEFDVCATCGFRVSVVPLVCCAVFATMVFAIILREESVSSKGTFAKIILSAIATIVFFASFGLISFSLIKRLAMIVLATLGVLTIALYGSKFFEGKKTGAAQNGKEIRSEYLELAVALFGVIALVLTVDSLVGASTQSGI